MYINSRSYDSATDYLVSRPNSAEEINHATWYYLFHLVEIDWLIE